MFSTPIGNPAPRIVSASFDRGPGSYDEASVSGQTLYMLAVDPPAGTGLSIWVGVNGTYSETIHPTMPSFAGPGLPLGAFPPAGNSLDVIIYTYKSGRRSSNRIQYSWTVTP